MNKTIWRPFVLLAFGSMLGVMLAARISAIWVAVVLSVLWFIILGSFFTWRRGLFGLLVVGSCLLFFLRFIYVDGSNRSLLDQWVTPESIYMVLGEITSAPIVDGDRLTFDFKLRQLEDRQFTAGEKVRVTVRLQQQKDALAAAQLERGSVVRTQIKLQKPSAARNPGAFDYRKFLFEQRIHWLGEVAHLGKMQVIAKPRLQIRTQIDRLRQRLAKQVEHLYAEPYQGLIRSLILGEREQLDPEIEETYIALGIIHVLSISGLHVSILVGLLFFLLTRLQLTKEQAAWLILLLLPIYVLLTGAGPPIVRAAVMSGLALIAIICKRWKDVLSFLAIAFLIELWWNPYLLFTPGFQFTFFITTALIIGVKPLADKLPASWKWGKEALVSTLIAQMVSFPIAIRFFYEFTFLSWLANLLFVPLLSCLVLPGSMLAVAISFVQLSWGAYVAEWTMMILAGIQQGITWIYPLFSPLRTFPPPSLLWISIYLFVIIYIWIAFVGDMRSRLVHRLFASGLLLCLLLWSMIALDGWETRTKITFLDVGQGDAILIKTDQGKTILIDGGGTPVFDKEQWQQRIDPFEVGKKVVVPYLKYQGIQSIDTLILTHGDADHIGGLSAVVERFPVKRVIRNALPPHSSLEKSLLAQFEKQEVPIYTAPIGVHLPIEPGITWQFLHPNTKAVLNTEESTNNDSVVILLSIYGHQVLMTGDIEQAAEEVLLKKWELPKVDVLKIAHHGSRTSTSEKWLQAIHPKDAVISVGSENRYGHPATEVLRRLAQYQTNIWRTDTQGAIMFSFYPDRYQVETMLQPVVNK